MRLAVVGEVTVGMCSRIAVLVDNAEELLALIRFRASRSLV